MNRLSTHLFRLQALYSSPVERLFARRLLLGSLQWTVLVLVVMPFMLLAGFSVPAATTIAVLTISAGLAIPYLITRRQLSLAAHLMVLDLLGAAILTTLSYRIDTPFMLLFTLPLMAAGVLLPRSRLLGLAVLIALIIGGTGAIQNMLEMEATPLGETITSNIAYAIAISVATVALNTSMLVAFSSSLDTVRHEHRQLADLIQHLDQTGQTLRSLSDSGEDLNRAVEQIRDALDLYHVQLYLVDPADDLPVLRASTGFIGRRLLEEENAVRPDDNSPLHVALRQRDSILILATDAEEQRSGFLPATRSELLCPLQIGDWLPLGVLELHSSAPDAFSIPVQHALAAVAGQLALGIYAARQTRELRASYQERDRLAEQIDAGQRELARLNRQWVSAAWGTYLEDHRDRVAGFIWQNGELIPAHSPAELVQAAADGQAVVETRDGAQVLGVPIRLRGQTLGVLEFQRSGSADWSSHALDLAEAVADRLALALENARLFEQAQMTAHREQLVGQVTAQMQGTTDLQALLAVAAEQFQDALGATHTQIRLGILPGESNHEHA